MSTNELVLTADVRQRILEYAKRMERAGKSLQLEVVQGVMNILKLQVATVSTKSQVLTMLKSFCNKSCILSWTTVK